MHHGNTARSSPTPCSASRLTRTGSSLVNVYHLHTQEPHPSRRTSTGGSSDTTRGTSSAGSRRHGEATGDPPDDGTSQLLSSDLRVASLHRALEAGPRPFVEIAEELFPIRARTSVTRHSPTSSSSSSAQATLLAVRFPARYHFLLRSLEGAFITLRPEPAVFLERGAGGEAAFEVRYQGVWTPSLVGVIPANPFPKPSVIPAS